MPHPREHNPAHRPLEPEEAVALAERMAMFATGSRLRILYALLAGERSVEELADAAGLPANTVSQQLRMLGGISFRVTPPNRGWATPWSAARGRDPTPIESRLRGV
jgi:Bacterial regulatory protein, arsR family